MTTVHWSKDTQWRMLAAQTVGATSGEPMAVCSLCTFWAEAYGTERLVRPEPCGPFFLRDPFGSLSKGILSFLKGFKWWTVDSARGCTASGSRRITSHTILFQKHRLPKRFPQKERPMYTCTDSHILWVRDLQQRLAQGCTSRYHWGSTPARDTCAK